MRCAEMRQKNVPFLSCLILLLSPSGFLCHICCLGFFKHLHTSDHWVAAIARWWPSLEAHLNVCVHVHFFSTVVFQMSPLSLSHHYFFSQSTSVILWAGIRKQEFFNLEDFCLRLKVMFCTGLFSKLQQVSKQHCCSPSNRVIIQNKTLMPKTTVIFIPYISQLWVRSPPEVPSLDFWPELGWGGQQPRERRAQ